MQKISFCERYMLTTAVLKRFKTNTRRLEKALERAVAEYEKQNGEPFEIITQYWDEKRKKVCCLTKHGIIHVGTHYKLNEIVAVAQSYKDAGYNGKEKYGYCYDENEEAVDVLFEEVKGWNNKLFVKPAKMPHQIQITGVRIEKLQAISDEDCMKEGVVKFDYGFFVPNLYRIPSRGVLYSYKTPREAFAALIDRPGVGHKGLWGGNPWVVVYSFKLFK